MFMLHKRAHTHTQFACVCSEEVSSWGCQRGSGASTYLAHIAIPKRIKWHVLTLAQSVRKPSPKGSGELPGCLDYQKLETCMWPLCAAKTNIISSSSSDESWNRQPVPQKEATLPQLQLHHKPHFYVHRVRCHRTIKVQPNPATF